MKTYKVNVDNEAVSGVDVEIIIMAGDMADENTIEATLAETVRRIMASVNSTPFDSMAVVKVPTTHG